MDAPLDVDDLIAEAEHGLGQVEEDDDDVDEYARAQPWDHTQPEEDDEEDDGQDGFMATSYAQVLSNLATLQTSDVTFGMLKSALDTMHAHFNDIHADQSLYRVILEKLGCDCEEEEECLVVTTEDGKYKGKEAIRMGLHNMAQVIGVIHMSLLKCDDLRASLRVGMTFDDDDLNVKLAELYYRQSAFTQRVMVDYDIAHPMASSSRVLLNKAMLTYQEHAAFYRFMDGAIQNLGRKAHRNTDMVFMIYFTIYQLRSRGYRVKNRHVYKQIIIKKQTPVASGHDQEGNPQYRCCHKNKFGQRCNKLRWEHKHPIKHLWRCEFEESKDETWNTCYWEPIDNSDFYGLDNPTITEFVYKVAADHGTATTILQGNKKVASDVEEYLVRSCSPMVDFLETQERTYSCWNGILVSSKFYTYDNIPSKYENICVDKYFPKWYFHEEDERAMRGKPCAAILHTDFFQQYKRPPEFQFDGYVQNVFCTMCAHAHDMVNHSKCGYHDRPSASSSSSSSSSSSAVTASWVILCTKCDKQPGTCQCEGGPVLYRIGHMRYLHIPTIHWDQLIMTQIRGMTVASPTEPGAFVLLPESEHLDTYRWATALYFRSNFRIGPHAKVFDGEEVTNERSHFADNWRVAAIFDGETNTGKTASMDMIKMYLPEFGNLSDKNQGKFMLEQCVHKGKFKPIIMGEMGPNSMGRTLFCALVDANTVIPVSRKGITDVNAVCDRQITLLCNKFSLAGGDVEGSVKSRMAMLKYQVEVPTSQVDTIIHNRNKNDPIPLVRMGNWAYEDISSTHGHRHFAEVCPRIFLENRAQFESKSNPLRQFLNEPFSDKHGQLVLDPDVYMLRKDLIEAFRDHCKLNGIYTPAWSDDAYDLRKAKVRPAPLGAIKDEEGLPTTEKYVYGIAPANDPIVSRILARKRTQPVGEEVHDAQTNNIMEKIGRLFAQIGGHLDELSSASNLTDDMTEKLVQHTRNVKEQVTKIIEMKELTEMSQGIGEDELDD